MFNFFEYIESIKYQKNWKNNVRLVVCRRRQRGRLFSYENSFNIGGLSHDESFNKWGFGEIKSTLFSSISSITHQRKIKKKEESKKAKSNDRVQS
jgi:hypothetical protein